MLHRWLNKRAETLSLSVETIAVSRQHDLSVWLAAGEMAHGWALVMHGEKEGLAEIESGIAGMRTSVAGIQVPFLSALIEAYVYLEMYDEALRLIADTQTEAAISMARLWQQQGKLKKAHLLLNKIYGQFTEGFATSDLQEAKALLQEFA